MTTSVPLLRRLIASLVAGLVTALAAYAATMLVFYLTSVAVSSAPANIPTILLFFLAPALVLFVLLSVAIFGGALTAWYRALGTGIVAGVAATYLGAIIYFLRLDYPSVTATSNAAIVLGTTGLPFVFAAIVAMLTVPRSAYSWIIRASDETPVDLHRVALVRRPAAALAQGLVTHIKRKRVSLPAAQEQWAGYVAALEAEGFTTIEVDVADDLADSVFIEDALVMLGQTAVLTSPGAESRRDEIDAVEDVIEDLGLPVARIRLPGTLDGGDVLKIGATVYVGRGGRTNAEGIRQFRSIAGELGYTVVTVPVSKVLHLKSAVTALPDGTVLGFGLTAEHPELFGRYLEVPEESGVAVVVLSPSAVLMASSAPKTAALIADLGYRVVTVDIREFEKLEGCVTCLSVRIR